LRMESNTGRASLFADCFLALFIFEAPCEFSL
jgi:hypothetical protein